MEYLQDAGRVLLIGAKNSIRTMRYLPLLLGIQIGLSLIYQVLFVGLLGVGGGLMTGIVLALIEALKWSVYLYALSHAVHGMKFTTADLKSAAGVYFRDVYTAAFVLYILRMITNMIQIPYIDWIVLIVFSALPETIYLGRTSGFENVREAVDFQHDNWYIWVPMTLLMVILLDKIGLGVTLTVPVMLGALNGSFLIRSVLHMLLFSIFMIFRGHVFGILYGSTMRKRKFMAKF